jgi:hypothetical protein
VTLVDARMTADIVRGATTNRVRVRVRRKPRPKRARSLGKGLYRADGTLDGRGTVKICITLLDSVLGQIAIAAQRGQMSRSAFLRQAFKHYDADVAPPPRKRKRQVGVSIPRSELETLDAIAKRHGMDRSALLAEAALYFIQKVFHD